MFDRAMAIRHQETAHEQLRREIEQQVDAFLAQGGQIDRLSSPNYQPNRVVKVGSLHVLD
ncbi:hypothetical protein [Litorivivens sp.]|uniref:hypothetical protein n=1 Tax=Litorivivens sp. TaxID=2020868 RepID=UPI003568427A